MTDHPSPEISLEASSRKGGDSDAGSPVDLERERLARVALTQLIEPARSAWSAVIGEYDSAVDVYRAVLDGTINESIHETMNELTADAFARARLADQLAGVDPE
ncbi:MAG: hypothetical protein ACRDS9_28550, partial [Pseudonocardiaceae bacterium]